MIIRVISRRGTMVWGTMRGPGGRRLALLIGLILGLGGCGQLASQQPSVQPASASQQTASMKLPPL
jgi:hypothetical protein